MPNRQPFPPDLHLSVELQPHEALDIVEYLARQASHYDIKAPIEVRRNHQSTGAEGRHHILCNRSNPPTWHMHLLIEGHGPGNSWVVLGLARYKRSGSGIVDGRIAEQFMDLTHQALRLACEPGPGHRSTRGSTVVPLRPFSAVQSLTG